MIAVRSGSAWKTTIDRITWKLCSYRSKAFVKKNAQVCIREADVVATAFMHRTTPVLHTAPFRRWSIRKCNKSVSTRASHDTMNGLDAEVRQACAVVIY